MGERQYRSTLRSEQAAATRERILTAAGELFADEGFARTTVAAVARRAGVATPTVYAAFGSKGEIVQALLTRLEDDAGASSWWSTIADETDPRAKLASFAAWSRRLFTRGRPVFTAALGAAEDPAVRALRDRGDHTARAGQSALVADLARAGVLRPGLTESAAVDRMWALSGPELYLRVTGACHWTDDEYERWLAELLVGQLLDRTA